MNNQTQTAIRLLSVSNFDIVNEAINHTLVHGQRIDAEDWDTVDRIFTARVSRRVALKSVQSGRVASMSQGDLDQVDFTAIVEAYRQTERDAAQAKEDMVLAAMRAGNLDEVRRLTA